MSRRPGTHSIAASPTLVGALTTLIMIVAVFLAYNANNGLPFVPVYRVFVDLPSAARITPNNDVRIGGHRVGVVESIRTIRDPVTHRADARLGLKLERSVKPLTSDTRIHVRYRSSFGLKYLELLRGHGSPLPEGGTIPASQSVTQVEFDDVYNTFDRATRDASKQSLVGFGDAFAGRGASINQAVEAINPLFRHLLPVAQSLGRPGTRLSRFITALADSARIVAPVAIENSQLFSSMARTFAAFTEDTNALRQTISKSPPTLQVTIDSLPVQRALLADTADLSHRLRPGAAKLPSTLPPLNDALEIGTPTLRRLSPSNRELGKALNSVDRLVQQPATGVTLRRLDGLLTDLRPLITYIAPFQTVCNYINDWTIWISEHLSEQDHVGFIQRAGIIGMPKEQANPLDGYSTIPANGRSANTGKFDPHKNPIAHGSPYQGVVDAQGNADCQAGQTGYLLGSLPVPDQPKESPVIGLRDFPGNRGPTFTGRPRIPENTGTYGTGH